MDNTDFHIGFEEWLNLQSILTMSTNINFENLAVKTQLGKLIYFYQIGNCKGILQRNTHKLYFDLDMYRFHNKLIISFYFLR